MRNVIFGMVLLLCAGMASAQCVAVVSQDNDPSHTVNTGPVHNMEFQSSNNPIFFATPDKDPVLYFPGAHWIQFGNDVDAAYIKLVPNWTANGSCPRTWYYDPISWMLLSLNAGGGSPIWKAGPLTGGNVGCSDGDSDDWSCYFSVFNAGAARSPQIAVTPGEVLYAYDCFYAVVSGSNPSFGYNTGTKCGVIKLVVE